ncbi:hypothetical protein TNCV_5104721 [Trichonephila clavipes]|nr:hypothetical protein TNCV_5104721 [Trichonephila clavipes]
MSPSQYGGYDPRLVTEWVRVLIPTLSWSRSRGRNVMSSSPTVTEYSLYRVFDARKIYRDSKPSKWCGSQERDICLGDVVI